jgi:Mg2+ and Co2+ transporter CorA
MDLKDLFDNLSENEKIEIFKDIEDDMYASNEYHQLDRSNDFKVDKYVSQQNSEEQIVKIAVNNCSLISKQGTIAIKEKKESKNVSKTKEKWTDDENIALLAGIMKFKNLNDKKISYGFYKHIVETFGKYLQQKHKKRTSIRSKVRQMLKQKSMFMQRYGDAAKNLLDITNNT